MNDKQQHDETRRADGGDTGTTPTPQGDGDQGSAPMAEPGTTDETPGDAPAEQPE